jgi:hypothetical protein
MGGEPQPPNRRTAFVVAFAVAVAVLVVIP